MKEKQTAKPLVHHNRGRPIPTGRRLPTRYQHTSLFPISQEIKTEVGEVAIKLVTLLKTAVTLAADNYQSQLPRGEAWGWFSGRRHGAEGQDRAEIFCAEVRKLESETTVWLSLQNFFDRSDVKYNHHSFASYLLDEFNNLLEKNSFPSNKPEAGKHYDYNSWLQIKDELTKLISEPSVLCSNN